MLRRLPTKQLFQWQSFELVEPFADRRSTWLVAQICAMLVANTGREAKLSDYLLEFGEPVAAAQPAKGKTWQELKFIARQWVAACKPQPRRKRK